MNEMDPLCAALARVKSLDIRPEDLTGDFGHLFRFGDVPPPAHALSSVELSFKEPFDENQHPAQIITRDDLLAALRKRLHGEIASDEMRTWANFLITFPAYDFESDENGDLLDCSILDTLHLIATPEINGELTDARVRHYLNCLESGRNPIAE